MNSLKSKRLPTVNIECRKSKLNNQNQAPLYIRITINRKSGYISIKKYVNPTNFNSKKQKMQSGDSNKFKINAYIQNEKEKIESIILDLHRSNRAITFDSIKEIYLKGEFSEFIQFVKAEIEEEKILKSVVPGTLQNYISFAKTIQEFKSEIMISDIDMKFLKQFRAFLTHEKKYKPNTVRDKLKYLRKFLRSAYNKKLSDNEIFTNIKLKEVETNKEYLTFEELEKLHQLFVSEYFLNTEFRNSKGSRSNIGKDYHATLQHFLIACYTGLRHSDMKQLRKHHLVNNMIKIDIKKTKKTTYIPVRQKLLEIIDTDFDEDLICYPVFENAKTNSRLKFIIQTNSIDKHITFHSARHTFAILSLLLSIPLEVISDVLGHSTMNITKQFYAKIVDDMRNNHMDKWDKLSTNSAESSNSKIVNMNDYEKDKMQNRIKELEEQVRLQSLHLSSK